MGDYSHLLKIFNTHLSAYLLRVKERRPVELYQPETYILGLGGKRVRPLLSLIACELFGGEPARALPCALAVELFHNFSLVHDDILDEAPLRRGKPTVHARFGAKVAILSGDAILVRAMRELRHYPDPDYRTLSDIFQRTAVEVCEGQQLDMNFELLQRITVADYIHMIRQKTAVLLGCSLQMGAICANASEADQKNIYAFGEHLGIAFQLRDDLLDCFPGNNKGFGKKKGGDIAANKKTFLWLAALERGNSFQKKELLRLFAANDADPETKIETVLAIFKALSVDELCAKKADKHTELAINLLHEIGCKKEKRAQLENFALQLLQRQT